MRYLPLTEEDRSLMLAKIGAPSIDELYRDVPEAGRMKAPPALPDHASELDVERHMARLADANRVAGSGPFFVGAGAYRHHVPATVDHLIQRGEFLTAYTPYQPEISQGTLQVLFEFQTQVAMLYDMDVANASLYDGSTGAGEAILMARRITRRKSSLIAGSVHPHYSAVAQTVVQFTDNEVTVLAPNAADPAAEVADLLGRIDKTTACVVVQTPNVFGHLIDLAPIADAAHRQGALLVAVVTEVVAMGALTAPGTQGADIVVGEGQSLGNGLNFGGPYLGLFATRQKYVRQMPGRLCGETTDAQGKRGFVLTLSTREQHIRREKATSNICTNSGLCALAFSIHLSLLGETGLKQLALLNHRKAVSLAARLQAIEGVSVLNTSYFNEMTLALTRPADDIVDALATRDILAGVPASRLYGHDAGVDNLMILAVTETVTDEDMDALVAGLTEVLS